MKKLTMLLMSGVLMFGAVACSNPKTSADAPNSTQESPQARDAEDAQAAKKDATSEVRRKQLNANIKAEEERNNITGGDANKADSGLASEVQSKLEANIPDSALVVKAENGAVTVSGTVTKQEQITKIEPEARKIKGVKSVNVKATVAPPKANKDNNQKAQ